MKALLTLSAIALSVPSLAQAPDTSRAEITAFADRFDKAQLEKNSAALDEMISDNLVFIDSSGKRSGKKEFIEGWTSPGDSFDPITLVDRIILPLGSDAAVVNAETTLTGVSGGKRFSSHFRFADTFKRVGGKWQAIHIQVTRLP